MALHIFVFMTHSPILERELLYTVFEFLSPSLDTAAFLVATMLNTLKLVVGDLSLVPEFHIEIFERLYLLLQGILLGACPLQFKLCRIDVNHRFFILLLADTAHH